MYVVQLLVLLVQPLPLLLQLFSLLRSMCVRFFSFNSNQTCYLCLSSCIWVFREWFSALSFLCSARAFSSIECSVPAVATASCRSDWGLYDILGRNTGVIGHEGITINVIGGEVRLVFQHSLCGKMTDTVKIKGDN